VFLVSLQLVLVRLAVHDPSFSIEDGYYAKATSWDARRAQDAQNARLGWQLEAGWSSLPRGEIEVVLQPTDASGATLTGLHVEVEAFAVVRSSSRVRATLVEGPPGEYRAPLRTFRAGLWELSFTAKRGADTFTLTKRVDLPGEGSR
jgi:nitrogen fixation protein FixH